MAPGGGQKAGQHLDRGRFPGPVGAQETKDLARWYLQGQIVDRLELSVELCEVVDGDQITVSPWRLPVASTMDTGARNDNY